VRKQISSLDQLGPEFSGSAGSTLAALEIHLNKWYDNEQLTGKIRQFWLICDHFFDDISWHLIGHTVDSERHSEINNVNQVRNWEVR